MSEIKHEPGPWEVNDQRASGWMNNAMYVGSANTGLIIARVYNDKGDEEANARLIAAAPDLLDVLIELTDLEGPLPGNREWHAKALSAIAKATGAQS